MKKTITLLVVLYSLLSYSQQYTIPASLVMKYVKDGASTDMIIKTEIDKDNFYEVSLTYNGKSEIFKLKPLTFPSFQIKFKDAIEKVIKQTHDTLVRSPLPNNIDVQNEIAYVFTQLVTYFNTQEERPEVATIHLKDSIPVYYETKIKTITKKDSLGKKQKIKITDSIVKTDYYLKNATVEISFFGGFIEKMQVNGTVKGKPVSFNNKYSIGISSTKNISQLSSYRLFSTDKFTSTDFFSQEEKAREVQRKENDKKSILIYVDEIIRYVKKVDVNANDISPVPQLVILDKNQKTTKLYREESSKLFEAVVYTDFLGVFDEENPNGIIQTEVNKNFNLTTRRFDFLPSFIEAIGFFHYFNAQFQFSKIEKNNKFLVPNSFDVLDGTGNVTETVNYYSPISLYQYRNYAVGGQLNLLFLENQNAKINVSLDGGFLFGRSGVKENATDEEGRFINNLEIPFELKFLLLPEKRFSFSVADRLSWFESFDSNINLKSIEKEALTDKNRWLNTFTIGFNLDISTNGKLFLRYKLIHELDNINTNFSQLQFGYSFYLLQKNGVRKDK